MSKLAMLLLPTLVYASSLAQRPVPSNSIPAPLQPPTVASQSVPRLKSTEERKAEWQAQHHIILNVAIRDAAGAPVPHLLQKDVAVLDNAREQRLQSFRELAGYKPLEPVHGVLVLDTLDNSPRELLDERRALESFLAINQGQLAYPLSLAVITDAGATVGKASQDGHALIAQIEALPLTSRLDEAGGTRGTPSPIDRGSYRDLATTAMTQGNAGARERKLMNLNRRFQAAVPAFLHLVLSQQDTPGRCLMIWLGQGWPTLSEPEFIADSPRAKEGYFQSVIRLTNALREGQVTVYNVVPHHSSAENHRTDKDFLTPVQSTDQANASDLSLRGFALYSGGEVVDGSDDLVQEIVSCLRNADAYYSIAFDAPAAAAEHEYHSLQVKVTGRSDLVVSSVKGYYDEP